jgi:hypothetical protein
MTIQLNVDFWYDVRNSQFPVNTLYYNILHFCCQQFTSSEVVYVQVKPDCTHIMRWFCLVITFTYTFRTTMTLLHFYIGI